ncbi:MAG: NUDIX hydrolase [Atopobiaceae bacterium]|jgi:ADP-ribose pyrophosphatase
MSETESQLETLLRKGERLKENILHARTIFAGKIFQVLQLEVQCPNKSVAVREIVRHSGGAGILAVKNHKICLVRQYRVALARPTLEIPAGKLEAGEDPAACAARELKEETGLIAQEFELVAVSYGSPGFTDEKTHIFAARGLTQGNAQPDADEFLDVVWIDLDEALWAIKAEKIVDSKTIIAIYEAVRRGENCS